MANTKQSYYIPVGTGVDFKFSGTKAIYTAELQALLGITATLATGSKAFGGAATNYGISRIRVRYIKSGTGDSAVLATGTVLVAPVKLEDALKGLTAQKYKGKTITEAYIARRRVYV